MKIKFSSYNLNKLNLICQQFSNLMERFGVKYTFIYLPTKIKKVCLPTSMFIYKNTKKHFERRCHTRMILINNSDKISVNILSNFKIHISINVKCYL